MQEPEQECHESSAMRQDRAAAAQEGIWEGMGGGQTLNA